MESSEASSICPLLPISTSTGDLPQVAGDTETAALQHQPLRLFIESHLDGIQVSIRQLAPAAPQLHQIFVPLQQRSMRLLA